MVPGTSVFLSSETGMSGNFEIASRVQVPFRTSRQKVGLLVSRCSGQGPHLALMGEPRGFSRVSAGFSSYDVEFSPEIKTLFRITKGVSSQTRNTGLLSASQVLHARTPSQVPLYASPT